MRFIIIYSEEKTLYFISLTVGATDVSISGISGSENLGNQLQLFMMFEDVHSSSLTGPKICGKLIYDCLKSF